jgi:hypothetical protein
MVLLFCLRLCWSNLPWIIVFSLWTLSEGPYEYGQRVMSTKEESGATVYKKLLKDLPRVAVPKMCSQNCTSPPISKLTFYIIVHFLHLSCYTFSSVMPKIISALSTVVDKVGTK